MAVKTIETIITFETGELSPYLTARPDLEYYHKGCKKLENIIIWVHGGITKRPGLKFIAECKDV